MKQTAVEWLLDNLPLTISYIEFYEEIEKAKEMEKQQIKDAYRIGWINYLPNVDSEQYYNETFKQL